jgi:membrane dipeptidase
MLSKEEEQRALDLHKKAIVINACDTSKYWELGEDYPNEYYPLLKNGGVTATFTNLSGSAIDFHQSTKKVADLWKLQGKNSDITLLATSADDVKKAKQEGKIAWIFATQFIDAIEEDVNLLAILHRIGIRCVQLAYQRKNFIGDGCGERTDCGISYLGSEVVDEMNRLGILIDLSHVGRLTTLDVIECSKDPVCITHSAVKALNDHCRCKSDEEIQALAEKDGVIGITPNSQFIKPQGWSRGDVTIEDYINHIDYVANLVGADHVGIGLDIVEGQTYEEWHKSARLGVKYPEIFGATDEILVYDWTKKYVSGLSSASELCNVTKGLVSRGYPEYEILKILGGNWLRLMEKVCSK